MTAFLEQATELQIQNRGLREIIIGSDYGTALAERARARLAPLTEQLVWRAQASDALRDDVVATDLPLLQFMSAQPPSSPRRMPRSSGAATWPWRSTACGDPIRTRSRSPA